MYDAEEGRWLALGPYSQFHSSCFALDYGFYKSWTKFKTEIKEITRKNATVCFEEQIIK